MLPDVIYENVIAYPAVKAPYDDRLCIGYRLKGFYRCIGDSRYRVIVILYTVSFTYVAKPVWKP